MVERIRIAALQGVLKAFRLVRVLLVAFVFLLIGFSARQLLDAYGPDMIPFVKKEILHRRQAQTAADPRQDVSSRVDPVEPRWN